MLAQSCDFNHLIYVYMDNYFNQELVGSWDP